jgi:hypothetical protein
VINLNDIADMCTLTREEIAAIAEHEHVPEFDATMLAEYLMHLPKGPQTVNRMICDDARAALHAGDLTHARELFTVLQHFIADHPEAIRGAQ